MNQTSLECISSQLETFTKLKEFVDNPRFHEQRGAYLGKLDMKSIDAPLVDLIVGFSKLTYCFTLQSCYGHFLYGSQKNPYNIKQLPISDSIGKVEYRIAYIALCIEKSVSGITLLQDFNRIPAISPRFIQFGCAEWFWQEQVNSYVLQVEPPGSIGKDSVMVDYPEALQIEKIRNKLFAKLDDLLQEHLII